MDLTSLHDAIVGNPDDEAARAAYADAIQTTDPERAEFIKLQLELARLRRAHLDPPETTDGYNRQHALRTAHGERWAADVRELVTGWLFRRGFVEEVTLDAAKFLAIAPELYRRAPVLHLNLAGAKPVARELFASPHLDRIVSLRLTRNELGDAEASLLAGSPHVINLRWLDLGMNLIGDAGLEALAASERLPKLAYLGFADNAVADPTPTHADEYDADTKAAKELQQKYGPRRWLSASPSRPEWPPERDAV